MLTWWVSLSSSAPVSRSKPSIADCPHCRRGGASCDYSPSIVFFTWTGFDEMDEVNGDGHAELLDDGFIEITFAYHNGDEAILKAKRETSSTAC